MNVELCEIAFRQVRGWGGGEAEAKRLERKKKEHNPKKKRLLHYCTARLIFNWWKDSATEISSKCTHKEKGWMSMIQQHKRNATVRFWEYIEEGKVLLLFQCCAFFKEKVDFGHDPHSKAHCVRA